MQIYLHMGVQIYLHFIFLELFHLDILLKLKEILNKVAVFIKSIKETCIFIERLIK